MLLVWISLVTGILSMIIVALLTLHIYRQDPGTPEMRKVARYIRNGAKTFLKRQYKTILIFVFILSIPLAIIFQSVEVIISFFSGALLSMVAAYIGMNVAVRANVRTARAAFTTPAKSFLFCMYLNW